MPDDARIVLHVGAHKTGTSLIQKYMGARPDELARMGIAHISRTECNSLIGWGQIPTQHPELLRNAVLDAARTPLSQRLPPRTVKGVRLPGWVRASRLGPVRTVVASHENALGRPFATDVPGLYPSAHSCAQGLRASVGDLDVRIIHYIRSQESFLESYYLQTVHQGGTATFAEWLARIDLDALSWEPVVDALVEAVGPDRVVVRDFAEIKDGQNAFLERFLRTCDPSLRPSVHYTETKNISVSQQGLELALVVNPMITSQEQRRATRRFLQTYFNNLSGPRPALLTQEQKESLRERYSGENAAILARLGAPGVRATS